MVGGSGELSAGTFAFEQLGGGDGLGGPGVAASGVDLSPDQVEAARVHCADLPRVRVDVGDARTIAAADGSFDASVTTQVLEYVPDVDAALAEQARITRPGGRFVNVATNWGSLFWAGGDEVLTARIRRAWERHAPHPDLPVALPGLLEAAGFGSVAQQPLTIMDRHVQPGTWAHGIARLMAAFARTAGEIDDGSATRWLASLDRADEHGRHLVTVVPVLTTATRRV